MADSKISALTALGATPASGDLFVTVDISDTTMAASGTNKKVTFAEMTGGFLLATGATTGATSQAQTFTNGIVGPNWQPASDGTTAVQIRNASGTSILNVDTTNSRVGIGTTAPAAALEASFSQNAVTSIRVSNNVALGNTSASAQFLVQSQDSGGFFGAFPSDHANAARRDMVVLGANSDASGFLINAPTSGQRVDMAVGQSTVNIQFTSSAIVFNETGTTQSFRVEGDTDQNLLYTDAANDRVGIGTASPTAFLDIKASTTAASAVRLRTGSGPTSPNAGDLWNDGALTFYMTDATTNAVVNRLNLHGASSGTPAAGFGVGVRVGLMSSTTANQDAGRLTWAWSTATHASRAAIGKLTAYYTSTEREAITWVADSTGVAVGINTSSPQALLHVASSAAGGTSVLFQNSDTGGKSYVMLSTGSGNTGGAGNLQIVENTSGNRLHFDGPNNRLGLNVTSPAGLIHGYDGSGGCLFVNRTGVSSTLVTVIPDGTGDVTERLHMFGWVSNSSGGFVSQVNEVYLDVSTSTTKTDGSNTLTIAVTAAGAFTLQTTLGSATWKVLLWVFWR